MALMSRPTGFDKAWGSNVASQPGRPAVFRHFYIHTLSAKVVQYLNIDKEKG